MIAKSALFEPNIDSNLARIKRGLWNLRRDPQLISSTTGANRLTALGTYLKPQNLLLSYQMQKKSRLGRQKEGVIGGLTLMEGLTIYAIVRLLRPSLIIETGVANGVSATFILQALNDNKYGKLFSIDLPLHETCDRTVIKLISPTEEIGALIPDHLRSRWKLYVGDVREVLPRIISEQLAIDVFFHDSDHSYDHMLWEFESVWPHLSNNGVLLSHDVDWNDAFNDFVKTVSGQGYVQGNRLGILKKSCS